MLTVMSNLDSVVGLIGICTYNVISHMPIYGHGTLLGQDIAHGALRPSGQVRAMN